MSLSFAEMTMWHLHPSLVRSKGFRLKLATTSRMVIISRSLCLVGCVRVITSAVRRDGEMLSLHQSNAMDASHILDWPVAPNVFDDYSPCGLLGSICRVESGWVRCRPKRKMLLSRVASIPKTFL
jgi:hypothetical protein